jgi:hypothetical protein
MSTRKAPPVFDRSPFGCLCPDWLIDAWEDLVHRTPNVRAADIAERMGVDISTLYDYATKPTNPSGHHICAPDYRIVPATRASGNPILINALAQHAGLSSPRPRKPSGESADNIVSHAIGQIGDVLKDVGKAITERPLRAEDKRKIRDGFRKLRLLFDDFDATVSQRGIA